MLPRVLEVSRCHEPIQHSELEIQPRAGVTYRCHVCRLELKLDPLTSTLAVAPVWDDESLQKFRGRRSRKSRLVRMTLKWSVPHGELQTITVVLQGLMFGKRAEPGYVGCSLSTTIGKRAAGRRRRRRTGARRLLYGKAAILRRLNQRNPQGAHGLNERIPRAVVDRRP